jgi:uncharacterized membrane protein YdjX (TVP38/TMEM64 family)
MAPLDHDGLSASSTRLRLPLAVRAATAVAILSLAAAGWQLRRADLFNDPQILVRAVGEHVFYGMALFLLVYWVAAVAAIPTLPLNLAAGWLWGPVAGGVISALGTACGATIAFGAARTLFGQPLRRHFDNHFLSWAQEEFDSKGWRFVAFVRLNPVFPSGPLNYLFGLTSIPWRTYVWGTALFVLPPSIAVAWIGHSVADLRGGLGVNQLLRVALIISAAVTAMAAIRYGARYLNYSKSKRTL